MGVLDQLKPAKVFEYFEGLCSVPHGSGNTKQISDLICSYAKDLGLRYIQDELNNVIVYKDATPGFEKLPVFILQGHMDMVCAKTDECKKDMAKEGLDLATDGEWVWAKETSLGGDNCIAVAIVLAILADDSLAHPALEAVFTIDEETGMDGANGLAYSKLRGKYMLNLDSEEEGVFTVSCAGGIRVDCTLPAPKESVSKEDKCFELVIDNLLGGHSGCEIGTGRANSNKLMGRLLYQLKQAAPSLRIASMDGGVFDNVICNKTSCGIVVAASEAELMVSEVLYFAEAMKGEYSVLDPNIRIAVNHSEYKDAATAEASQNIINLLMAAPQGVLAMSAEFEGLVETSLNIGVTRMEEKEFYFTYSIRSSVPSRKLATFDMVASLVSLAGGKIKPRSPYPSWPYNKNSKLLPLLGECYKGLAGKEAKIEGTHGGLECGSFASKLSGLDVVSIGPDLLDIHSPREKLSVASTERLYKLTCSVLSRANDIE